MPTPPLPGTPEPLPPGGMRTLLRGLGSSQWGEVTALTGRLALADPAGTRTADMWVRAGSAYAARMDGYVPPVAQRLRSTGRLPEGAFDQLAALPPHDAGPRAIAAGVPADIIEAVHREVLLATVSHLYEWSHASWSWAPGETTSEFATTGIPLALVASAVDERIGQWNAIMRIHPRAGEADAVPRPGPAWGQARPDAGTADMTTMLSCIDGTTPVARIAAACGFTRFEVARLLSQALADGIVAFELPQEREQAVLAPASPAPGHEPAVEAEPASSRPAFAPAPAAPPGPGSDALDQARGLLASARAQIQQAEQLLDDANAAPARRGRRR